MKKLAFLTTAFLLLSVSAVLGQDVRYDFDKEKDFSKYKTYKWVAIKGADRPDDLMSKRITATIDAELATKGMTKTEADTADLYIGYQTAIGQEKLVWRGVATKTLDPKAKPEKKEKNITKAVAKLLKNFPPKPKS